MNCYFGLRCWKQCDSCERGNRHVDYLSLLIPCVCVLWNLSCIVYSLSTSEQWNDAKEWEPSASNALLLSYVLSFSQREQELSLWWHQKWLTNLSLYWDKKTPNPFAKLLQYEEYQHAPVYIHKVWYLYIAFLITSLWKSQNTNSGANIFKKNSAQMSGSKNFISKQTHVNTFAVKIARVIIVNIYLFILPF